MLIRVDDSRLVFPGDTLVSGEPPPRGGYVAPHDGHELAEQGRVEPQTLRLDDSRCGLGIGRSRARARLGMPHDDGAGGPGTESSSATFASLTTVASLTTLSRRDKDYSKGNPGFASLRRIREICAGASCRRVRRCPGRRCLPDESGSEAQAEDSGAQTTLQKRRLADRPSGSRSG